MLPYAKHLPSIRAKSPTDPAVSTHILANLPYPESNIRFWSSIATFAAVPKATIDKNRDLRRRKCEVRSSRKRGMPTPAGDSSFPKNGGESQFRASVPTALYQRHLPRSLWRRPRRALHFAPLSPILSAPGSWRISSMKRAKMSLWLLYGFARAKCSLNLASMSATDF